MADISDIVNVVVSTQTAAVKQAGFGLPLIVDYHTRWSERIRVYSDLDAMLDDDFEVTDAAYMAAAAAFAQDPQLNEVAVGRRALAPDIEVKLVPTAADSKVYSVDVTLPDGSVSTVSITSDTSASVAEIVTALTTPLNALTGIDATDNTTHVTVTATTPGNYIAVKVNNLALIRAQQVHADPGIATDMAAIADESRSLDTDFYGVTLTTQGKAELESLADWVEDNKRLMIQATQDGDILTSATDDVASENQDDGYNRSALIYCTDPTQHAGAALMAKGFVFDPGSVTFANLKLAGITSEPLTGTHISNLQAKNVNYKTSYGTTATSVNRNGKVASGEFIDIIRDRDWWQNLLEVYVLQAMTNVPKVPFTDQGIAILEAAVRSATEAGISAGFFAEGTAQYTVPLASEVASNDRANRTLGATPIRVSARVSGAIHVAEIRATITV